MELYRKSDRLAARPGVILMIVVVMLALFAVVGVAFVLYAESEANASRIYREGQQRSHTNAPAGLPGDGADAGPIPTDIFNEAMRQLLYDLPDDSSGVYSALRGSSLARTAFGLNYTGSPVAPVYAGNNIPFNGIGQIRTTANMPPGLGVDRFRVVNNTYFPSDKFLFDPERIGYRTLPTDTTWQGVGDATQGYYPINANYTYPDAKDIYLAAIDPVSGKVLVPSFYRPWIFGSLGYPANNNWQPGTGGRYALHRPSPFDHQWPPGTGQTEFPFPAPNPDGTITGDIQQLEGTGIRQNDSLWMDIDLPVRTWKGKTYKPLVAFLITDLDGRMNLNVAGDMTGQNGTQGSNQGWGPWEMDIINVLTANQAESLPLLSKRYGTNYTFPTRQFTNDGNSTNVASPGTGAPFYSNVDFDGSTATNGPGQLVLPPTLTNGNFFTTPTFGQNFQNGSTAERTNHPLLFNPYLLGHTSALVGGNNRVFGAGEMRYLNYKFNGDDANYMLSSLGVAAPTNLGSSIASGSFNPRFGITTVSNDFDRMGLSPWLFNQATTYQKPNNLLQPGGTLAGVPFPGQSQRYGSQAVNPGNVHDFDPQTWKALGSAIGAIDLNRRLADYRVDPTQPFETPGNVTAASSQAAINDRQQLATDIFNRFCVAVGTQLTVNGGATIPPVSTPQYDALRFLAQLSVNIVDYIDGDDYMTPFVWNPGAPQPETLWGTEVPRLVVNEAYVEYDNNMTTDMGLIPPVPLPVGWMPKATLFDVKVWLELHNPLTPQNGNTSAMSHGGAAPLFFNGTSVYKIKVTRPQTHLRDATNNKGEDDDTFQGNMAAPDVKATVLFNAQSPTVVPTSNGNYSQPGAPGNATSFFLVGPEVVPGSDNVQPTWTTPQLKYTVNVNTQDLPATGIPLPPTILVQRLACPHLPFDPNTNPYVTVDYFVLNQIQINDGTSVKTSGPKNPQQPGPMNQRYAYGRHQPLGGDSLSQVVQMLPANSPATQINHTFYRHNGKSATGGPFGPTDTLDSQFNWYVQPDRALISPIELLFVSAYRPHELTQQFILGGRASNPGTLNKHMAIWDDNSYRLYRALELFETRSRILGMGIGGRLPGKVNINTIWNQQVFQAICDANGSNYFTQANIATIWNLLQQSRTPTGVPGANDQPFRSYGAPIDLNGSAAFPRTVGVDDTILRHVGGQGGPKMFDNTTQTHPYLKNELLIKVANNLTTRSNSFAVWMTVGYFEVRNPGPYNDNNRPVLGKEMGIEEGSNVRHKFFAVVDRTKMSIDPANPRLQGLPPVYFAYEPLLQTPTTPDPVTTAANTKVQVYVPATYGVTVPVTGQYLTGIYDGDNWIIKPGDTLTLAPDGAATVNPLAPATIRQQTVTVTNVSFSPATGMGNVGNVATLTLTFTGGVQATRGSVLQLNRSALGNPGPQPGFNFRDPRYSPVVPYAAQIK